MKARTSHRLTILNQSARKPRLQPLREAVLTALSENGARPGEVEVLLADDSVLKDLNQRMRGINEATDVLTFPADPQWPGVLGQVAVSMDFAARGSAARGVTLSEETAFLALHGALHLAGWEDETEEERHRMVAEMNRIARLTGLTPDEAWASQPHLSRGPDGS